jgi:hypothetical protein
MNPANLPPNPPAASDHAPMYQADQLTVIREWYDLTIINWDRLSPYAREQLIHAYYNDLSPRCARTRMRMGF